MTWSYRIVERKEEDGTISQGIYEVYYDKGTPLLCTKDPVRIAWDKGESTMFIFNGIKDAFGNSILQYDDIANKELCVLYM